MMTGKEPALVALVRNTIFRKQARRECHLVLLGDEKVRPVYCERSSLTEDELETCTCCQQCCTCGG